MVYDLGKIIPRIKGDYSAQTQYDTLDIVYYNGSSYICKQDNTRNKVPTNTTYWQIMALKGEMTTQLTPAQVLEIVNVVMNQGVVVDSTYSQFRSTTEQAIQNMQDPGAGILTIKRNGSSIGTFSANASTNKEINIDVPTTFNREYKVLSGGETEFEKVEPGMVYSFSDPIDSLIIKNLVTLDEAGMFFPAFIEFEVATDFTPTFGDYDPQDPSAVWARICDLSDYTQEGQVFKAGGHYILEVLGNYLTIRGFIDTKPE